MSDSFTVRTATVADAPILARHRAEMFRDMGVLPERLLDVLVDASRRYFEEAIPSGEYAGLPLARRPRRKSSPAPASSYAGSCRIRTLAGARSPSARKASC